MRLRLVIGVVAFLILVSLGFAFVLVGSGPVSSNWRAQQPTSSATAVGLNNAIAQENAQLGTRKWEIPANKQALTQIQAYAGATSVMPNDKLTFYVSTEKNGDRFSVEIYRLGWYGGDGARLMTSEVGLVGQAQGYYNSVT